MEVLVAKYNTAVDKHRRFKSCKENDLVMTYLCKRRFSTGECNKIAQVKIGQFCVLHKISDNVYIIDLPESYVSFKTFGVQDL